MSLDLAQPAWLASLIAAQSLGLATHCWFVCISQIQAFGVISTMTMPDGSLRCGLLCCRGIPVFAHLEGAVRQQVWDLMQRRPCQAGEIIIEQASWGSAWPDHWAAAVDCCPASCTAQPQSGFFIVRQAPLGLQPESVPQRQLPNYLVHS